jgi:hypothetical protein
MDVLAEKDSVIVRCVDDRDYRAGSVPGRVEQIQGSRGELQNFAGARHFEIDWNPFETKAIPIGGGPLGIARFDRPGVQLVSDYAAIGDFFHLSSGSYVVYVAMRQNERVHSFGIETCFPDILRDAVPARPCAAVYENQVAQVDEIDQAIAGIGQLAAADPKNRFANSMEQLERHPFYKSKELHNWRITLPRQPPQRVFNAVLVAMASCFTYPFIYSMEKRKKTRWSWLVVAISLLGAVAGLFQVEAFDTFFHLASGELILETGRITSHDPFSFSFRGAVWHNHSPLFQIVIALIHRWAGFVGLSLLQVVLAGAITFAAVYSGYRSGANIRIACVLAILPVFIFRPIIIPRPHVFSFLTLQACLSVILSAERDGKIARLVWLPVIYAAWLGSHGSHPVEIAVMAFWFAGAAFYRNRGFAVALGGAIAVCLVEAALLKPESFDLAGAHLVSSFLANEISEWRTLSLTDLFYSWSGIGFIFLWVLSLIGLVANSRLIKIIGLDSSESLKRPYHHSLLLLGFMVFSLTSSRMAPFFILGAAPLWLPEAVWTVEQLLKPVLGRLRRRWPAFDKKAISDGLVLVLSIILVTACLTYPSKLKLGVGLQKDRFPFAALAVMKERGLAKRIYNAYNWGGFLIFNKYPKEGVFVDSRAITVYPADFLEDFVRAYSDFIVFERLAEKYRVDSVLMPMQSTRTGPLLRYLEANPKWRLAYYDSIAALFVLEEKRK